MKLFIYSYMEAYELKVLIIEAASQEEALSLVPKNDNGRNEVIIEIIPTGIPSILVNWG